MPPPQKLPTQPLGRNGPQVPRMGFGLMGLSTAYGEVGPDQDRLAVLDRAWALGATLWDTSAAYGDSEDLVGAWLRLHPDRRADLFLCTKFGVAWREVAQEDPNPAAGAPTPGALAFAVDTSPAACRASCERSLRRLGVAAVDLFYVHRFDRRTPVEETMGALVQLKREGKIRHIGFSECSSATLRRGHAVHPIAAVQVEYNPWTLDIEGPAGTDLLATCRELGVAIVAYSPLGRGFITGRYKSPSDLPPNDHRRRLPRFSPTNFPLNLRLADAFRDLAAAKSKGKARKNDDDDDEAPGDGGNGSFNCTPAQAVLAWIAAQGPDFFPIPGTKSLRYLDENVAALAVTVTPGEDRRVRAIVAGLGGACGDRSIAMAETFADTPPLPAAGGGGGDGCRAAAGEPGTKSRVG